MRMKKFNEFMKKNWCYISKELKYYSLDADEINQESALIYFSFPEIEKMYTDGFDKKARSKFISKLRKSAKKYSKNGIAVRDSVSYQKQEGDVEYLEFAMDSSNDKVEKDILISMDFNNAKDFISGEKMEFVLYYLDYGQAKTAKKYNISKNNVRIRYSRIVNKIRAEMGL